MKILPLSLALLGLGLALPVLAACTSSGTVSADSFLASEDSGGASSDGFPAPNQEMVWQSAMTVVRQAGYVPDPNLSQAQAGRIESRWRLALQPFSGRGHRERVTVRILKVPKRRNYFKLATNVMRQANDNIAEPSNPLAAEWTEGKRQPAVERMINQRVELMYLRGDASNEFLRRHGLPGAEKKRYVEPEKKKEGPIPGLPPFPFP